MLVAVLISAEIAFWVLLGLGLVARYLLGWRRTGGVLLALSPAVDLVILAASLADLRAGAVAGVPHLLSAVYLGISVAWGHAIIRWADQQFAHRFAGGPRPAQKPSRGRARAAYELQQGRRHLLAWSVGVSLLGAAVLYVGDWSRTETLVWFAAVWTLVLVIDLAVTWADVLKYRAQRDAKTVSTRMGEWRLRA